MIPAADISIEDAHDVARIRDILTNVPDPEIPVLSVVDLGIVRDVRVNDGRVEVDVTPTYSGCPATDVISNDIETALANGGYANARVNRVLSPPWTTDLISEAGRGKLKAYGIAPPVGGRSVTALFGEAPEVPCPRCESKDTELVSPFGSTPCKAHYKCRACAEPFDYFKCL
jgi:ring-1,2-phenylacetyl-CoA epoxidase subunit PaaD